MKFNQLTHRKLAAVTKPGAYGDGAGLYLQVSDYGTKSWCFRYTRNGRSREMGLGSARQISLKLAREIAKEQRAILLRGDDPIEVRRAKRGAALAREAARITFQEAAEQYIFAHSSSWKNSKHRDQWKATLETYAYPVMGKLPVDAIELPHVLKVLEPMWHAKTETASRLRGRIERILSWATVRKYRSGENPARWTGHLDEMLPSKTKLRKVRHHPALSVADLPAFMAELHSNPSISARALELTILTATRTNEVIGARWSEVAEDVWTVPGERMKASKTHQVPLSRRAIEILESLPREGEYVFPGARAGAPLSNMAMLELLRGMRGNGLTVHGFRSTFRDWAGDQTNFARELIEAALAHRLKDKAEAAYRRSDALEKRRELMEAWAKYCSSPVNPLSDVVALHSGMRS
jgi:integrase